MKRSFALSALTGLAFLVPTAHAVTSAEARVLFTQRCTFELPSGSGVRLTTAFTLRSVGELPALVKVTPGWRVAHLNPKAPASRTLRLRAGQTVKFSVTTRFLTRPPSGRAALKPPARIRCASVFVVSALRS